MTTATPEPREAPRPLDPKARAAGEEAAGALWLVAVPIGNLEDITLRALRLLESASLVACEDTRTTRQLYSLLNIKPPPLISCHEHNEAGRVAQVLEALSAGRDVALVSDAGTPNISDPGSRLVRAVVEAGFAVTPLPGPCAAIAALSASGLSTERFTFVGFLPSKPSARRRALAALAAAEETLVFYESPHRLEGFLADAAAQLGGEREAVVARELTKRHETFRRAPLAALAASPGVSRGEVVVVVAGASREEREAAVDMPSLLEEVRALGLPRSAAAKWLSQRCGLSRQEAYAALGEGAGEGEGEG